MFSSEGCGMKDRKWATPGVRVATTVLALAFASSLSSFADGQVVTLSQSVAQALANGPDMRISRANLGLARDQFNDAASANGLGVSGNLGYDRAPFTTGYSQSGQPIQVVQNTFQGGLTMSAPLSTSVSLEGSHSITEASILDQATNVSLTASAAVWDGYRGGQALAAARIAAFTLQGTESSESASQKTVVYNVKQAYYTLLGQQRQIAILQQTLAQREAELQKTQSLYDARNVSQIDLKQAQVNRLGCRRTALAARGCRLSARHSRAVPSAQAVRMSRPSGLNSALCTPSP